MQRLISPLLIALAILGMALFWFIPPIAQPQWYHDFADQRRLFGVANFWNVISSLPFSVIGAWGVSCVAALPSDGLRDSAERWMYLFLFTAVVLTGLGSVYYHLGPNDTRLVWDRLPITATFMALFAIIVAERVSRAAGVWLFVPLILIGFGTVLYWDFTESLGRGDLRPYFLTQFYPMVAIPLILVLCPAVYTDSEKLYSAIGWYAGAKVYEFLDKELYAFGQLISGHTLKHIGVAISCYMLLSWIRSRRRVKSGSSVYVTSASG